MQSIDLTKLDRTEVENLRSILINMLKMCDLLLGNERTIPKRSVRRKQQRLVDSPARYEVNQ